MPIPYQTSSRYSASHSALYADDSEYQPEPAATPFLLSADVTSLFDPSAALFSPVLGWESQPTAATRIPSFSLNSPFTPHLHPPYNQQTPPLPCLSHPPPWSAQPPAEHVFQSAQPRFTELSSSSSSSCSSSSDSTQQRTIPMALLALPASSQPAPPPQPTTPTDIISRRRRQRKSDAQRRKRQAAALSDLKQLLTAAEAHTKNGRRAEGSTESDEKQQRVQVLEGTVEGMRQLLRLVEALKHKCETLEQHSSTESTGATRTGSDDTSNGARHQNATEQSSVDSVQPFDSYAVPSTRSSSKRLRLLVSTVSRSLDASLGHATLESTRRLPITVAAILLDCDHGTALEINDGMLTYGWERDELIGSQFSAPYEYVMGTEHTYDGPLMDAQYERSKRLKRQLYAGEIGKCVARWRIQLKDGLLYEVETTTFIDGWRDVHDSKGGVSRRPVRAVAVTSLADIMPVD